MQGLAGANLIVGVLNLVPGLPLDGGRVLRALVWRITGNMHRGTIVAGLGRSGRRGPGAAAGRCWSGLLIGTAPDVFDYLMAVVIASFLWTGATASMLSARVRRRLPALKARPLARRVVAVPDELPIAEAVRRAQESGAGAIVVHAGDDRLSGVVSEAALLATPEERRAWVPVSAVSRTLEDGLVLRRRHRRGGPDPGDVPHPRRGVRPGRGGRHRLRRALHRRRRPRLRDRCPRTRPRLDRASDGASADGARGERSDQEPTSPWSGVRRGPLAPGEWVRLVDAKGRRHNICLEVGQAFHTNRGGLAHDDIIGRDEGFTLDLDLRRRVPRLPAAAQRVRGLDAPRAAVVYPKDAAQIVAMADIFPGARVVEAGAGSGALTCSLLRAVGPHGPGLLLRAARGVRGRRPPQRHPVLRRRAPGVGAHRRRPRRGAPLRRGTGTVDRVVLDMLAPWECVRRRRRGPAPGGIVVAYVATTTQLGKVVETLRAHGEFTEPQPWETLVRDWHVEGLAVRPGHKMNGHTGFLVTARRMAPGSAAPVKKRRPAPGAYGGDYDGPRPAGLPPTRPPTVPPKVADQQRPE